jgi:hypothetical protein
LRIARLWLRLGEVREWQDFLVTDLGPEELVLGLPWLQKVNPEIDWSSGTLNIRVDSERKMEQIAAN